MVIQLLSGGALHDENIALGSAATCAALRVRPPFLGPGDERAGYDFVQKFPVDAHLCKHLMR